MKVIPKCECGAEFEVKGHLLKPNSIKTKATLLKCPDCGKEGFVNKHFSTREENLFKDYELEN